MVQIELYSYLNLESTKTPSYFLKENLWLYSYLNLESTKTELSRRTSPPSLYSYLNLESTKTLMVYNLFYSLLYSYLNLESTKTTSWICYGISLLYSYLNLESTKTSNSSILVFVAQNHYKVLILTRQYYSSKYFNNIGLTGSIRNLIFILYWYKLFNILNATWSSIDKLIWRMSELNK